MIQTFCILQEQNTKIEMQFYRHYICFVFTLALLLDGSRHVQYQGQILICNLRK